MAKVTLSLLRNLEKTLSHEEMDDVLDAARQGVQRLIDLAIQDSLPVERTAALRDDLKLLTKARTLFEAQQLIQAYGWDPPPEQHEAR